MSQSKSGSFWRVAMNSSADLLSRFKAEAPLVNASVSDDDWCFQEVLSTPLSALPATDVNNRARILAFYDGTSAQFEPVSSPKTDVTVVRCRLEKLHGSAAIAGNALVVAAATDRYFNYNSWLGGDVSRSRIVGKSFCLYDPARKREPEKSISITGWLQFIYKESGELTDRNIATVISGLSSLLSVGSFSMVDTILGALDIERISIEIMISLLRTSFAARSELERWDGFRQAAVGEVARRGRDPEKVLRNLATAR